MCDRVICEGPPQCPPDPEQCRRIASRPTGIAQRTRSATPRFVWRPTLQPRHFSLVTSASSIGCGTRDGSDAIAFVQHTLASPVARMADYAELGGPPCGGAVFGQFVPLSGSDLRRPPRGPHPTCRAWQRGIGKGRGGSNTANLTHRCSRRVVHALPHALSPASRFSCYLRRRDSNVPSSTTTSLRQQNAWTQRRGM